GANTPAPIMAEYKHQPYWWLSEFKSEGGGSIVYHPGEVPRTSDGKLPPELEKFTITPKAPDGVAEKWTLQAHILSNKLLREANRVQVLAIGDTFEAWQGSNMGISCEEGSDCELASMVVRKEFEDIPGFYPSAIIGDQMENLLWRIIHTAGFAKVNPRVCVINIGTMDLVAKKAPKEVGAALRVILKALQNRMRSTVFLVTAILPRADDVLGRKKEDRHNPKNQKTSISFTKSHYHKKIEEANEIMEKVTKEVSASPDNKVMHSPPVYFLDCNANFLTPGKQDSRDIPRDLMPDMLHLSAAGHQKFAACIHTTVKLLLEKAPLKLKSKRGKFF
ncbi:hypothetical protein CYMTET_37482, partial [Cymbomonas tetramitiformis]